MRDDDKDRRPVHEHVSRGETTQTPGEEDRQGERKEETAQVEEAETSEQEADGTTQEEAKEEEEATEGAAPT